MRKPLSSLILVLSCLLVAATAARVEAASAGSNSRQSKTTATTVPRPPTKAELKRQANLAASRFGKAQAAYERLNNDMAKLGRQIDHLRAEIEPLKNAVTRRTALVYKGSRGVDALVGVTENDPVKSALGARLVAAANNEDLLIMKRLATAMAELERRQETLIAKKQEQQAALDRLEADRKDVESKLAAMVQAEKDAITQRAVSAQRERTLRAQVASARTSRSRRSSSAAVVDIPDGVLVVGDFVCPIQGPLAFADTFGDPRPGGRRHQGTDMMSPMGTDNVAVVAGEFLRHHSGAGGLAIYLYGDDGNTYYYAHLSQVVGPDRRVTQGELIGKTGATGNARGGSPHTHFEIHPNGGRAVNSYPTVKAHC